MPSTIQEAPAFTALLFTKTEGFRHRSIPNGIDAINALAEQHSFQVDASEDSSVFTDENMARYDVVIFLNTTGDILSEDQQAVFERFIAGGGGFVGVHSATDTEYDWPWYGQLVGAYFAGHPAVQEATLRIVDPTHPSTTSLPASWTRTDEWYNFRDGPGPNINVLINLDETTYSGGEMGASHPAAWYHTFEGGRAWYTALGHTEESYSEPLFLEHLLAGIRWAAGLEAE